MSNKKSNDRKRDRKHKAQQSKQPIADQCGCFTVVDACGCQVVDPCGCYVSQCCC
jgi:hypothetical protein